MMRLSLHPDALAEFEAAATHYDAEQPGLGRRFVDSIEAAFDRVAASPASWPELAPGIRRHLARVFPYAILYTETPEGVIVLAIMHCHRQPGYWRHRSLKI